GETLRAPLAGEDEIGHRPILPRGGEICPRHDERRHPDQCSSPESLPARVFCCDHRPPRLESAPLSVGSRLPSGSSGEVSERLKEHAWKVCKRLNRASGVRIPLSPPLQAPQCAVSLYGGPVGP